MTASVPTPRWRRLRRLARVGAGLGHAPRLLLLAACLVIACMYCTNDDMGGDWKSARGDGRYRPVLARGDGHMHFLMARSLVFDHDLIFDNDLARFGDPWNQGRTKTGRKGIPHPIGPALVWTPLLAAAEGGAVVANQLGADIEEHGYTSWHQRIVFASTVVFACLSVLLGVWVFRRRVGGRWAPAWAGTAVLLGTSLTYYATYMPSYVHAMDAAASGGFLAAWALTLGDWRWRRVLLLGALLGLAGLVRSQELALGIVVAIEVVVAARRGPPDGGPRARWVLGLLGKGAAVAAVAGVVFIPQLVAWQLVYGEFTGLPQGPNFTRPTHPMITEVLFAARNGWLSTHPIAYAGVLGLIVLAVRGPRLGAHARLVGIGLLAAVIGQVYLNSIIYDWWASASFGQRRLCSMTLPVVVGLATWIHVLGRTVARWRLSAVVWHGVTVVVLGWFVAWNLGWVSKLHSGRPAERRAGPICCRGVPGPLAAIGRPVYRALGNPFALPASARLAVRYGLPLQRWDDLIGVYPFLPAIDYTRASIRGQGADWDLGGPNGGVWIVHGVGPAVPGDGRLVRWTTGARAAMLVPNNLPEPQRVSLRVTAARPGQSLVVRWDGRVVVRIALAAGTSEVAWDIEGTIGLSELGLETDPAGIAIGVLRFTGI